ncbi:MAG: hypothetical protein PHS42_03425 [Sulfurimonas sp.]|jgi:hypothetical protein|nr:hypothetical protein [Sulfurimonas sp.]
MEFFNVVKKVTKGAVNILASVADKAAEQKAKAEKKQREVMVHKSDSELKDLASESGINGMAARMELKKRGV